MSDSMTTQSTSGQPFAQGQVSLPDGGQILTTDTPATGTTTNVGASPANQPAPPPQNKPVSKPLSPQTPNPQQPPPVTATIAPKPMQNVPTPPKAPSTGAPTAPVTPAQDQWAAHPAVQKASLMSSIARTLAGNPETVKIDPTTGEEKREPAPLKGRDIALAIALEALGGAAAGAAAKPGPGVLGRAAAAGFGAGQQQQEQRQQKAEAISQEDYTRKLNIVETNMKLLNNARMMGRQNASDIDDYIKAYAPMAQKFISGQVPGYLAVASYNELSKYDAAGDSAIPYERVARIGADGKQVEINGEPQWDIKYVIYDPKEAKAAGLLSPEAIAWGKTLNMPGMNNPLLDKSPTTAIFSANQNATLLGSMAVAKEIENKYAYTLNHDPSGTYEGLKAPTFSDPNVQNYVDDADKIYANVPKEAIAGIIQQESGGDPSIGASKWAAKDGEHAIGLMQVLPSTAASMINPATGKPYTVDDLNDPATNVKIGTQYFAQLLHANGGDIQKALIAYHGGGPNSADASGITSQQYADNISKLIGLDAKNKLPAQTSVKYNPPNWSEVAGKNGAYVANTLAAFQAALNATANPTNNTVSWAQAVKNMTNNPETRAQGFQMLNWLGGDIDTLNRYDRSTHLDAQAAAMEQKLSEENAAKLQASQQSIEQTEALIDKNFKIHDAQGNVVDYYAMPHPPDPLNMSVDQIHDFYTKLGYKLPDMFTGAALVAHNDESINTFAQRVWGKGTPNEADRQTATNLIHLINPNWKEGDYNAANSFRNELASTKQNTAGGNLASINFATAHLDQLNDLAVALDQKLNHSNIVPLRNWINKFGAQFGVTQAMTDQAIATAVGQEVARGVAGSKPDEDVVHQYIDSLQSKNTLGQAQNIIQNFKHLLYARAMTYDDKATKLLGRHIGNEITPQTTAAWQAAGWATPWAPKQNANVNGNQPNQPKPPTGAIGKFTDKTTGKVYWTDGKNNLGLVQE